MFRLNGKKIDINSTRTVDDITYPHLRDPALRAQLGVEEVPDPVWPQPADEYYVTENADGTLNVTPKSQEQIDAQNAEKARIAANTAAKADAKADNVVQYLRDHTAAECEQYVQDNVTDLASAKAFLKKVAVVLCVLSKGL